MEDIFFLILMKLELFKFFILKNKEDKISDLY